MKSTSVRPEDGGGKSVESPLDKLADLVLQNHFHPVTVYAPNGIIAVAFVFLALAAVFQLASFEQVGLFR